MAKRFQFDEFEGRGKTTAPHCVACEEMLADALDESLSEADRAWFDQHVATCADCSEMLADAQRGAAWLEMLKTPRPEPSARLMERILAETSAGMLAGETRHQPQMVPAAAPLTMPATLPGNLLQFRSPAWTSVPRADGARSRWMFEPRLAMTAAMAFFSIALTLNLTGVQLNRLHASELSPAGLKRTYYTANAQAVRYYDNLRVVRVLESRVEDLREAVADRAEAPKAHPQAQPKEQPELEPRKSPDAPKGAPEQKRKPAGPGVSRQAAPFSKPELPMAGEEVSGRGKTIASFSKLRGAGGLA